jgi:hypothetical protein
MRYQSNVSLGREVELYNRVVSNDPANSALILAVLSAAGLESQAVLKIADTLADVLSGTTNEVTNGGYARKTLTNADLTAYTVDDTENTITLELPVQTWANILIGDTWAMLAICYDSDTTSGTDANIIPISFHDLLIEGVYVIPDGDDVIVDFSDGFIRAS